MDFLFSHRPSSHALHAVPPPTTTRMRCTLQKGSPRPPPTTTVCRVSRRLVSATPMQSTGRGSGSWPLIQRRSFFANVFFFRERTKLHFFFGAWAWALQQQESSEQQQTIMCAAMVEEKKKKKKMVTAGIMRARLLPPKAMSECWSVEAKAV